MKPVVAKLSAIVSLAPYATAALFTSAALLKVHYLRNYAVSDTGLFHSRQFSISLLETELLLSALLIYRDGRKAAVIGAIMMFVAFCGYNLVAWSRGVELCGCLGAISTSPQIMFGIDAVFVSLLFAWLWRESGRNCVAPRNAKIRSAIWILQPKAIASIALPVMVSGYALSMSQPATNEPPEGIEVRPTIVALGEVGEHGTKSGEFAVVNHRQSAITIAAILPDCTCTAVKPSKLDLAPGEESIVHVTYLSNSYRPVNVRRGVTVRIRGESGAEQFVVSITANIIGDVRLAVFPSLIDFGDVSDGESVSQTLFIRGNPSSLNELPSELSLDRKSDQFQVHTNFGLPTRSPLLKPISLRLNVGDRDINTAVHISDTSGVSPDITVPVRARVIGTDRCTPSQIALFIRHDVLGGVSSTFHVSSAHNNIFLPSDFNSDLPLEIKSVGAPSDQVFSVQFDRTSSDEKDRVGVIKLRASNGTTIELPIAIIFLDKLAVQPTQTHDIETSEIPDAN